MFRRRSNQVYTYGMLAIADFPQDPKVLLIKHRLGRGDWRYPKGAGEKGESGRQAAVREMHEETGVVVDERILEGWGANESFSYVRDGKKMRKTVSYFLARIDKVNPNPESDEIAEARWFTIDEAYKKLSFDNARDILESAIEYLRS